MRIIGGEYRSRILSDIQGDNVRPTSDRAREALFNILGLRVRNARVLDLFAGSGALGLESLSRGAREATFNDVSKESVAIVKKNIASLNAGERAKVFQLDYTAFLNATVAPFDLIFIDPPYRFDFGKTALQTIAEKGLLTGNGIAVYERDCPFTETVAGLDKYDERKYGKAYLTFFRRSV